MANPSRTVAGIRFKWDNESGLWSGGPYTFRPVEITSTCEAPHPTVKGYCWGDTEHTSKYWQAWDGEDLIVGVERFKTFTEVVKYAISEHKHES